jgi:hypothetical protein
VSASPVNVNLGTDDGEVIARIVSDDLPIEVTCRAGNVA